MSNDGEFITDGIFDTVEGACDHSSNMGYRWIFYPFHFIVKKCYKNRYKNHQELLNSRILESGIDSLKGRTIKSARKYIKENWDMYL
jgi:hypothetical protein